MEDDLQPTEAMIKAGIDALWEQIPGAMDGLSQDISDDQEFSDLMSDTATFIWQAMKQAQNT
ncbi:hypothetical protein AI2602V1_3523 [Citrobacter freundii]|uniref:hypothetical protein n=1 Tax=Citrobacter freundii TaxID=546 RepID=UPI001E05D9D3|nr:hypothetical protein [Citrobacter freundii]CAE6158924.1 hypothetical protein AI2602V1_3523 [Citrobacter freundii]CAH3351493.1 hypothetical protein AI2602V1_3523 [Citrobacter freundii]CAH5961321.1 hypothetical protein AI3058V1_0671 [Citrobacter freundii]HBK3068620.1 hypothetical protein [Citrobacter freundii]